MGHEKADIRLAVVWYGSRRERADIRLAEVWYGR